MLTIRLWGVLGAMLAAAVLGLFATFAWLTADPPVVDFSSARPFAEGHALAITEAWVNGRTTTLPVADGVDARFNEQAAGGLGLTVKSITPVNWTRDSVNGRVVETQFVLIDAVEADYVAALPFVFDRTVPVLAAYPSLLPVSLASRVEPLEYQSVPGLIEEIPQTVRERLNQWGTAYAAADGATMRDLADDTGATAEMYRGLGGLIQLSAPAVRAAVPTPTGLVVRVRFTFTRAGDSAGFVMDLDMLITAADSTKPRVVAWGAPGTGPSLQPYQNRAY